MTSVLVIGAGIGGLAVAGRLAQRGYQVTVVADGVWFPMGGMYRIAQSLAAIGESLGVRYLYDAPVRQIEVESGRAQAVMTAQA